MHPRFADGAGLLAALVDAGVEFVTVGGAAAALHGSSLLTADLDIVHHRSSENVDRLLRVLESLDACFRADLSALRLKRERSHLEGSGQSLLSTTLGPLDCRGALHDGRGFAELRPQAVIVPFEGRKVPVIDLRTLIEIKYSTGRAMDEAAAAELTALLAGKRDDR